MPDESPSPAIRLARYVVDAQRQRLYSQLWLNDCDFLSNNDNRLFYAVDTNVVAFYAAPWQMGPRTEEREGYGQVFHYDLKETATGLAYTLAEFLFFKLSPGFPHLILPPLHEEIDRNFYAVARNLEDEERDLREGVRKARKRRAKAAKALGQELVGLAGKATTEEARQAFNELLPRLEKLFLDKSLNVERFATVINEERIVPLKNARGHFCDQAIEKALEAPTEEDERKLSQLENDWFERLRSVDSERERKRITRNLVNDSIAIARLEFINDRLPPNRRLVYLTGDTTVQRAAFAVGRDGAGSFGELYVRHPKCFIAEARALSPEMDENDVDLESATTAGETEFIRLLETIDTDGSSAMVDGTLNRDRHEFLTGRYPDYELSDASIDAAKSTLERQPDLLDDLESRWANYTRWIVGQTIKDYSSHNEELEKLRQTLHVESIEEFIDRRVWEVWEEVFKASTITSYLLVNHSDKRSSRQARTPPVLIFDNFPHADRFVRKVISERYDETPSGAMVILGDLLKEDESGYTFYACFAMLFASQGKWHKSDILSRRSQNIAEDYRKRQGRDETGRRSGREGAYLRAVALRHTARSPMDLEDAREEIDFAIRCNELERPVGDPDGLRFEAESLSLSLTHHLFAEFSDERISGQLTPLNTLADNFEAMLQRVANDTESSNLVLTTVQRRLLTGLSMVYMIQQFHYNRDVDPDKVRALCTNLRDSRNKLAQMENDRQVSSQVSILTRVVYGVTLFLAGEIGADEITDLRHDLDEGANSRYHVGAYDANRFSFLNSLFVKNQRFDGFQDPVQA